MKKPRLTLPQWALLQEMVDDGGTAVDRRRNRVAVRLQRLGLCEYEACSMRYTAWKITERGREVIATGELP